MMKKTILILATLLLAGAVSAQDYQKNILGVRAGLNMAKYSFKDAGSVDSDPRTSFHVAVTDQILLFNKLPLYLETGLAYSSRGGKVEGMKFQPSYLQIPVLINYHFNLNNFSIQPFAGAYYGFGIGGKAKQGGEKEDIFGDDGALKRSDVGVRVGVGFTWKHIYLGAGYDIGCMDLSKDNAFGDAKIRNNCFTISVGYNF